MADLIGHVELHLGRLAGGTSGDQTTPPGVQVVSFAAGTPSPDTTSLMTLGLGRHHLQGPGGGVHQELLVHVPAAGNHAPRAAGILFTIVGEMISRGQGLEPGQLIGPRGALFPDLAPTALVATAPSHLPDTFGTYHAQDRHVHIVWLVQITTGEARVVQRYGWPVLRNALIEHAANLPDPSRAEIDLDALAG